jgi:predicted nucleotidyltransferase
MTVSKFGLTENLIEQVYAVLAEFPSIEKAVLYGSRAKGTYKPGSDIDLSLIGPVTEADLLTLENRLDDLLLPYTFDINRFSSLQNRALIDHIERVGQDFYVRFDPSQTINFS